MHIRRLQNLTTTLASAVLEIRLELEPSKFEMDPLTVTMHALFRAGLTPVSFQKTA